jgi:AcrR family transcriptional regulator
VGSTPDKTRRPGYAPDANAGVGRLGLHTRERILRCAADVFLAYGFHATSLDTIAKAANASRATIYQYFAGKDDIFRELSAESARDVLEHSKQLHGLGPTADGVKALHLWLVGWADIYDAHAAAFAEYPGIGTELAVLDVGTVAEDYHRVVVERLRRAPLSGLDLDDAAAALGRIPHMVNLYRHRAMFPLPDRAAVARSLTVVLQLMLFPDTPEDLLTTVAPSDPVRSDRRPQARGPRQVGEDTDGTATEVGLLADSSAALEISSAREEEALSPIAVDVLAVSSALFAERGYYAVGMDELAAAAGVSRATLYRHFRTKDRILAELTRRAVAEIEEHATKLRTVADGELTDWTLGYVRFHRAYRGVIRAWFDGTVAELLSDASVDQGIGAIHRAIRDVLESVELPTGVDVSVGTAVFLAVLGRMSEPTSPDAPDTDERAAGLMVALLRRSVLRAL